MGGILTRPISSSPSIAGIMVWVDSDLCNVEVSSVTKSGNMGRLCLTGYA